jgi:hypothetical protein
MILGGSTGVGVGFIFGRAGVTVVGMSRAIADGMTVGATFAVAFSLVYLRAYY